MSENLPYIIERNEDAQVIGLFLTTKARRSKKTSEVYSGILQDFFEFLDFKPIKQVTYSDAVRYSEFLERPNFNRNPVYLKTTTQNNKISAVKSFYKYAMKIGYVQFNPIDPIETQRVNSKVAKRILSLQELRSMFSVAISKGILHTVVFLFFAETGCRAGELSGVNWRDFFINPYGDVCVIILGKGHMERILKITPELWAVIQQYRIERGFRSEINPKDHSPMLINKRASNYKPQSLWKLIKDIAKEAGIKKNVSPHWLRHSYATEAARNKDTNIWRLQYDLGHRSILSTQIYVHITQGMRDTSVDRLGYTTDLNKMLKENGFVTSEGGTEVLPE